MRIIPVVDLKGGQVVHAVAGQRANYRPVVSQIAFDATPATIARSFVSQFGFRVAYVADLDAITGDDNPDWDSYRELASAGLQLILDCGIRRSDQLQKLIRWNDQAGNLASLVIASETIDDLAALPQLLSDCGNVPLTFSIDLQNGEWHNPTAGFVHLTPLEVVRQVTDVGCKSVIVLDLAAVGTNCGPHTLELCQQIRGQYPTIELISGGGIRNQSDLLALADSGCDAALVASVLHDGRLTPRAVEAVANADQ